jgi:hypothetical protein
VARGTTLALAAATGIWALGLVLFGGFATTIFTLTLRSHDPVRPLIVCAVAFLIYLRVGGRDARWVKTLVRGSLTAWRAILPLWRAGTLHHAIAGALVLAVTIAGVVFASTSAGVSDQYGYLSDAALWRDGRRTISQPWVADVPWPNANWTFSPLAFAPAQNDPSAIVPITSPGYPLLMTVAGLVGGACAPFWIVPLGGGLLILATYLIGLRLRSRDLGLIASFLVATSPPFLLYQMVPMTDVLVAGALAFACWFVIGDTLRSAAGASAMVAAVVLIRPNLVPVAAVLVLWLAVRIVLTPAERTRHVWRAAIVCAGGAVAALCVAAVYWVTYGSPFQSGYGPTAALFSTQNIVPNMRSYAAWFTQAHTPLAWLGLAALFLPVRWLWPYPGSRAVIPWLALLVVVVSTEFLTYLRADHPSLLRFFLVCYPFVMIGLSSVMLAISRMHRTLGPIVATALVVVVCVHGLRAALREDAFGQGMVQAKHADVAEHVRRATPENSVVIAMQHSGSLRYYAGRVTLRWDLLPPDWLDRAVAWMAERGVPTYALLDDFEQVEMVQRFDGQTLAATLAGPPVFRFGSKLFYDLSRPAGATIETTVIPVIDVPPRCDVPAPPPRLIWKG